MGRRTRLMDRATRPVAAAPKTTRPGVNVLHPLARNEALRLAEGNALRVHVITPTLCYVDLPTH